MFYFLLIISIFGFFDIRSEGDLALRSKKIELQLGSEVSDYEMSKNVINLETGKAYRLEISSLGFKEYEFEAEEFFKNIWIRKIEIDGIEIVTSTLLEIEFEREGEIEINFVPIRTGVFPFEIEGLQSKGMVGEFIIK
ncbi:MAG: copper-binding protein [Rickettsiales bacterium]|nr:copper-binding protein [Rickettsiales bacterium]|tara:strand:- start:111 stop:524 length:414 start_codon:yes stop_codon:yes gene_type:complete